MKEEIKRRIDVASGREKPECVLKNAKIVNVFTQEIIEGDIAIDSGKVVGIGQYDGIKNINLEGKYVSPGLIDGHMHIESSMVSPAQFAKAVVPMGTTTVIADPHEIANVCGLDGIRYILNTSEELPLNVYVMLPSCVPATPFENSGAVLEAKELKELINHKNILGLGELMNYPGVISADESILDKIELADGKIIDGHGLTIENKELNAYVAAGVRTEHECYTVEGMINRLRLGMYVQIRQGTAARNLQTLIKGLTKENMRRCLFCTDDKHPEDILVGGHIDNNIRLAVKNGVDPITAISMATINAAECYGLKNIGAIAPGYDADLVVFDNLEDFNAIKVFKKGRLVGKNKKALFEVKNNDYSKVTNTVNIKDINSIKLDLKLKSDIVNVIKLLPYSLITQKKKRKVDLESSLFKVNKDIDILKLAVVERHHATGNVGIGLVEGFGLKNGAIATTISHDSHNLIVIGDNDEDMLNAIKEVERVGGGIAICSEGKILKVLQLPLAGLLSNESMEEISEKLNEMIQIAYERLGVSREIDPFMTLSFIALPVIPELKLTDIGLFDVNKFDFIGIDEIDDDLE